MLQAVREEQRAAERNRSVEAFEGVFRTYFPRLMAYVLARVRDRELAQDVVAEAFARAYQRWESLRSEEALSHWLYTIAHNVLSSHLRAQARAAHRMLRLSAMAAAEAPSPEEKAIYGDELGQLSRMLDRLSERERRVLSLRFDGELTSREIAHLLGLSECNVRIILHRALRRLRRMMVEEATA